MAYQPADPYMGNQRGGFVDSPGGVDSPSKRSAGRAAGSTAGTAVFPLTVKMLLNAVQAHGDEVFKVDDKELGQVTVVGIIEDVQETATNVNYKVHDGTGLIDVRVWLDGEEPKEVSEQRRIDNRVGAYVRATGHLRSFMNQRSLVAFRIQPIADSNEITHHLLEVLYVHLYNQRGPLLQTGTSAPAQPVQSYNPGPQQTATGDNPLANSISSVLARYTSQEGASFTQILQDLNGMYTDPKDVRDLLEAMASQGLVYTTVDEDHYHVVTPC